MIIKGAPEKLWREYADCIYEGIKVNYIQMYETRRAFYAGMHQALQYVFGEDVMNDKCVEHSEMNFNLFVEEISKVLREMKEETH